MFSIIQGLSSPGSAPNMVPSRRSHGHGPVVNMGRYWKYRSSKKSINKLIKPMKLISLIHQLFNFEQFQLI